MLPKRVGLPSASPAHASRSASSQYGAPESGTSGSTASDTADTFGTVRSRARMPATRSTPCATQRAMSRTAP